MGGTKTVDATKYISKPDSTRDMAIQMAMQQAQSRQQLQQAELMRIASQMPPAQQTYDPLMESKRLGELGMANIQRAKELEKQTSPEAAAMRQAQGQELASLTSPEAANQYLNEWAKRQGLIQSYETGLQDSTIGQAAAYDAALQAKRSKEQENIALQQQVLQQMQAPVGGIDPASSIAAQQAAQGQNLQSMQNWQNAMYGNIGGYNQSVADQMAQTGANFQNMQQAAAQNRQNYMQSMLGVQAQNQAAKNAMTGAYAQAAGSVIGGAAGGLGSAYTNAARSGTGAISGYGGQQYVPKAGGSYYAPIS